MNQSGGRIPARLTIGVSTNRGVIVLPDENRPEYGASIVDLHFTPFIRHRNDEFGRCWVRIGRGILEECEAKR